MPPPLRRSPLPLIFLTIFIDLISFSIIFPLFPRMLEYYLSREGHEGVLGGLLRVIAAAAGEADSSVRVRALFGGVLGSLFAFLQFIFAPLWGSLSDRVGRRPVLIVTIAGVTLSYAIWFFSGSFFLLVAARTLGGIMSGNISVATAAVADSTTKENRAKGMGLIGVAFGLGFILGPAMGAALSGIDLGSTFPALERVGVNPFSAVAGVAALLSLTNLVGVIRRMPETLPESERGAGRGDRRTANLLKLFSAVNYPGVNRANLLWFIYLTMFSGMEFTVTFLAEERFGYSAHKMGLLFVYSGLIIVVVQGGMIRQLAPVYGERKLALVGLLAVIPGLLLTGLVAKEGALYLGLGCMALGSAFITPCVSALVSLYTPAELQGSFLGIFRSLGALARAVGPLLACAAYWKLGAAPTYAVAAALLAIPVVISLSLPDPRNAVSSSPDSAA